MKRTNLSYSVELLDAETFDNGDLEEPFNGFTVAVPSGDMSLTGLNGFALLHFCSEH